MARPLVAIVGRPNVGKSLLFNRLAGQRLSIVEDTPGVTRDRLYATAEWSGRKFDIVDTGGIEPSTDSEILMFMREQANIAINAANVIVLVTEIGTGVTAADKDVANMLLRSRKPVVLVVNKMDNPAKIDPNFYEFYSLGLGDPIAVSAVHGHGTGDMLDECLKYFPPEETEEADDDRIHVAIIGKPNVGKSSLTNLIAGQQRVIVSDVAGTTRDAVDTEIDNAFGKYVFIDTAGIRRKSKVDDRIEKFSVMRAQLAIERADVCLIMIDAREGVTEQDTKIAGLAHEAGKASIIIVNKWDLVEKETGTMEKMRKRVQFRQRSVVDADHNGHAQQCPRRRAGPRSAAQRQRTKTQDLLYDANRHQAAQLRCLLQQQRAVSLFLSALPGEPDPRDVRPGGHAHPHGHPPERG